jgi:O-antigen/teichoic acid export membrane protein/tetratricopeptide (TPR) repeat protein
MSVDGPDAHGGRAASLSRSQGGHGRQFITHNLVAGVGTGLAGLLGLLLQAMVSHRFQPAQFGAAFAVFTFFIVLTQTSAAFARMVAWTTSRELATGSGSLVRSSTLLRSTNNRLLVGGTAVGLLFIAAAPLVAGFLHVPTSFVILGALGVPFLFATEPLLASLQGQQRWLPWSGFSVAVAASRVGFVLIFATFFGISGVLIGLTAAAAAVYFLALAMVWSTLRLASGRAEWRPQRNFLILSIASTVAVAVLMGCDVLLVEHFFSPREGGQFSAVAVTSRALFFAMGGVTSVLFPKVAGRQASSHSTMAIVVGSVGLSLAVGVLGLVVFTLGGDVILRSFAGRAYVGAAGYIGWYAMGMPLLACVVMISNSLQSLADLRLLLILVPGALLKPVLIIFFHQSLLQVAVVSDISIGILFISLAVTYVLWERRRLATAGLAKRIPRQVAAEPLLPAAVAIGAPAAVVGLPELLPLPEAAPRPPARPPLHRRWGRLAVLDRRWWRENGRSLVDRPKAVIPALAVLGLVIRHGWLSTVPLSAGDWGWPDRQRLLGYFPWPGLWDNALGLNGENRFSASFRFPVEFVSGLLATLGASWTFIEQFLYFIPLAVLLPVSGWLLAREVMGRTRWALLTPLLLLGSTYFTVESNGEVPLTLAETVSMLVLLAFLRTMRRRSTGWAALTGLLLAGTAAFDIRPAYICAVLMAMYFVVVTLAERSWSVLGRRLFLGALTGAVFIGSQAFWLIPLLTYKGNPGFPTPPAPDFNILTLGHGLTGTAANWTGGQPAFLVQAALNPAYMILPLIALTPLLARRLRPEVVWLAVAALLFAFFAKTDTPPLGGVYDWMFGHVPGWNLFREGSKFLYVVTLAYAILIPIALSAAFEWSRSRPGQVSRLAARGVATAALVGVVALSLSTVVVLQTGSLRSTTVATPEPASFAQFSTVLAQDSRPGSVLWFGQPLLNDGATKHRFLIASSTHPAVNLTGSFSSNGINQRDPFQLYCADNLVAFCYLDSSMFPYLVQASGASYAVVPGGVHAGAVPVGVSRSWLASQMRSMFGEPTTLGSGDTSLLVWRFGSQQPVVTSSPAISLVDSGTWATAASLPALEALGLPAAYRQSFVSSLYPVAPANLPDTIRVLPRTDGSCLGSTGGTVAVMAQSSAASLPLSVAGASQSLPLLATTTRLAGWSVYGPIDMATGTLPIGSPDGGVTLGPCIAWSRAAAAALSARTDPVGKVVLSSDGEQLTASSAGPVGQWIELRRLYDPGWRLDGRKPTAVGDGLFNLYHLTAAQAAAAKLNFAFSTRVFEEIGLAIAVIVVLASLVLVFRDRRKLARTAEPTPLPEMVPSPAARWIGGLGIGLLAITALASTLEWLGAPSAIPGLSIASDPYATDVGYGSLAVGALLISLAVRVVVHTARSGRVRGGRQRPPMTARMGVAAVLILGITVGVAACGSGDPSSIQNLLSEADQAGSVAPTIQGASLDDARLQRSARQGDLCIADYTQALKDFPDLVQAYAGRAGCYLNGGQNGPAAVHDYTQAISLAPTVDLYLSRAVAYRVSGDRNAALADYQQAAAYPGATAGQLLTAIDGLVILGSLDAASAVYNAAVALQPTFALIHVAGAAIATAQGDDARADREFATAESLAANKAQTASVLAFLCHSDVLRHRYTNAASDCATAARLSNGASGAEDDLSATQLALGNPSAALASINASINSFISNVGPYAQPSGVDGFGLASLYTARGWIDLQLHQSSSALADFRTALGSLPPGAGPSAGARIRADIITAKAD